MNEDSKTPDVVVNQKLRSEILNDKIKEYLLYTGMMGSIISALAYFIITLVMIFGFKTNLAAANQIVFSILGAATGLMITFLLRGQGIAFAKREDKSQSIMQEYYKALNKTKSVKELRTIQHYVFISTIKDIILKGVTVGLSTWFILYIFIEGSKNWSLIGLATANILMFTGFGLVALSKSYDKYIEEHLPIIMELTIKIKEESATKDTLDLANKQLEDYDVTSINKEELE